MHPSVCFLHLKCFNVFWQILHKYSCKFRILDSLFSFLLYISGYIAVVVPACISLFCNENLETHNGYVILLLRIIPGILIQSFLVVYI